jgi:hypothetical protein
MNQDLIIIEPSAYIFFDNIHYKISYEKPKLGDLVLDRKDGTVGYCDFILDDRIAIKEGNIVECAVPMDRVYKLQMVVSPYYKN